MHYISWNSYIRTIELIFSFFFNNCKVEEWFADPTISLLYFNEVILIGDL